MTHNINVLPKERLQNLRSIYFVRLGVVACAFLILSVLFHGALLVPSYLYLRTSIIEKEAQAAALSAQLGGTEEEIATRAEALKGNATYLARLGNVPSASTNIRAILALNRPDVHITDITFAAPTGTTGKAAVGKMVVTGVAETREALRAYNVALSGLPFITKADLPISAYAKESNIQFSITLTGPLTP